MVDFKKSPNLPKKNQEKPKGLISRIIALLTKWFTGNSSKARSVPVNKSNKQSNSINRFGKESGSRSTNRNSKSKHSHSSRKSTKYNPKQKSADLTSNGYSEDGKYKHDSDYVNNKIATRRIRNRTRRNLSSTPIDSSISATKKSSFRSSNKPNEIAYNRVTRKRSRKNIKNRSSGKLTEVEYIRRKDSHSRIMVVRDSEAIISDTGPKPENITSNETYTQIAILEDNILVEHFVTTSSSASLVGNIYLGVVQNVLPSMEAAFVDIGSGRNGVLYAGELNWEISDLVHEKHRIENVLHPGDKILVQVSKDPIGSKGPRLTNQIALPGRHLVLVPDSNATGISRKLPESERNRLRDILAEIKPEGLGVIMRTASAGVSRADIAADLSILQKRWETITTKVTEQKADTANVTTLYEEPELLVKLIRDLFNEDFAQLVIAGERSWNNLTDCLNKTAPDLLNKLQKYNPKEFSNQDIFDRYCINEQLAKALARKVSLPSGGSLVIERTEAMTIIDVNTGKFTGDGGNLEETVTRNNIEAAEEIVHQMRLRDIGGIIIVDFIDMNQEKNKNEVLKRLSDRLSYDRARHQVSELTSLGLVQMTRKRIGTGLVEAFSTPCNTCSGRGIIINSKGFNIHQDHQTIEAAEGTRRNDNTKNGEINNQNDIEIDKNTSLHPVALAMSKAETGERSSSTDKSEHSQSYASFRRRRNRKHRNSDDNTAKTANIKRKKVTVAAGYNINNLDVNEPEFHQRQQAIAVLYEGTDQHIADKPIVVSPNINNMPIRKKVFWSKTTLDD